MFPSVSTMLGYGWTMFAFFGPLFAAMVAVMVFPTVVGLGLALLGKRSRSGTPMAPSTQPIVRVGGPRIGVTPRGSVFGGSQGGFGSVHIRTPEQRPRESGKEG